MEAPASRAEWRPPGSGGPDGREQRRPRRRRSRRRGLARRILDRWGDWLKDQGASIRQTDALVVAATVIALGVLALGALPFGAVGMPWRAILEAAVLCGLALAFGRSGRGAAELDPAELDPAATDPAALDATSWRPPSIDPVGQRVGLRASGLVALVGAWALLQSLPWPAPLLDLLAPSTAEAWREARALTQGLEEGGSGEAFAAPLSLAPSATRDAALLWLAGAAALALGTVLGARRGVRRLAVVAICLGGAFQVLYGAERWLRRDLSIWGLDVGGDAGRLRGTFVNPDHLALYLAIALACAAAWSWWALRKALDEGTLESRLGRIAAPLVLVGLLFAGIAFTGSRAGLLAALAALLVQGLALMVQRSGRRSSALLFVALAVALGTLALVGWRQGLSRWFETSAYDVAWNARIDAWTATVSLWTEAPLVGVGLGAYEEAFARVQPPELPGTWGHAHSDVLETLVTGGLVVVPLLLLAAWLVATRLGRVLHRGRRSEDRAAALAAVGAAIAALLHSLVDFGMTMPATAFVLVIVLGCAVGAPAAVRRPPGVRSAPRQTVFLHEVDDD